MYIFLIEKRDTFGAKMSDGLLMVVAIGNLPVVTEYSFGHSNIITIILFQFLCQLNSNCLCACDLKQPYLNSTLHSIGCRSGCSRFQFKYLFFIWLICSWYWWYLILRTIDLFLPSRYQFGNILKENQVILFCFWWCLWKDQTSIDFAEIYSMLIEIFQRKPLSSAILLILIVFFLFGLSNLQMIHFLGC